MFYYYGNHGVSNSSSQVYYKLDYDSDIGGYQNIVRDIWYDLTEAFGNMKYNITHLLLSFVFQHMLMLFKNLTSEALAHQTIFPQ